MSSVVRSISVGKGLEITLGDLGSAVGPPMAMIIIDQASDGADHLSGACSLLIRLTAARLRLLVSSERLVGRVLGVKAHGTTIHIPLSAAELVLQVVREIREASYDGPAAELFLQGKVLELLAAAFEERSTSTSLPDRGQPTAFFIRNILLASPSSPPDMAELSRLTGLSERRINDNFRAEFGETVFEWLANWRLNRARDLLECDGLPISEIARTLGYAHATSLSRAFTRRFGVPLSRMRSKPSTNTAPKRKRSLSLFAQAAAGMGLCMNPALARASVSAI